MEDYCCSECAEWRWPSRWWRCASRDWWRLRDAKYIYFTSIICCLFCFHRSTGCCSSGFHPSGFASRPAPAAWIVKRMGQPCQQLRYSILTEGRVFFGVNVFTTLQASKKFQGEFLVCCIVPNYACLRLFTFVYVFLHIMHNVRQHCDVHLMVPS